MSGSGDRHLRPEPSGRLKGLMDGPRAVLVRATSPYTGSFAGQVLLQLLINLLCRQFGIIDEVWLDIPATPVDRRAFPEQFPVHASLLEQLLAVGQAVGGHEVPIAPFSDQRVSVTVLVGPDLEPRADSLFTLVAYGDGWDAYCSPTERSPLTAGASLVPFGPLLAACFSSGQVFRYLHQVASWQTSSASLWDFGPGIWRPSARPEVSATLLPSAHIIGLGAVGAAFALSLALVPGLSGTLIGIDPQTTDETGRNRLLSALHHDVDRSKVALAARLFEGTAIRFYPNQVRWPDYVTESKRQTPPDVRAEEDAFRFRWVISCVDRNIHRQNIARYLPRHVLSGSTDGLVAQATYYALDGLCECLACNHPVPTFSMEAFVHELQCLSASERLERYLAWELGPSKRAAIEEYLVDPACGQVAEAELRRLGADWTTDWSVGFVSSAAGIMLAAFFTECALVGVSAAVGEYAERRLIFLGGQEFVRSRAQRKMDCPVCADTDKLVRFARRWESYD